VEVRSETVAAEPRSAARRIVEGLRSDGVRVVRLLHSDLFGRARSKQFPVEELPGLLDGVGYCVASLVEDLDGRPLDGGDFPADRGFPDMHAVADLDTLRRVPWDPDTAWVLADLFEQGRRSPLCSRGVLARMRERIAAAGLSAIIATEPEFYLVEPGPPPRAYSARVGMAYTSGRRADPQGAFDGLHRSLIALGIGVGSAHREFSPGQFEINLRHSDPLGAADACFLLKEATKELAVRRGLQAVFMPKPFSAHEGSSMHLHVSLWRDGANLFAADELVRRPFTAGVLEHVGGLTALASSTVNSYKRLRPGGLAPTTASFGTDSRLAYLRLPTDGGDGARVEVRGGDAASNPYLLATAVLAAGLDGIERGAEPAASAAALPRSLPEALDALERDEVLVGALGAELVRVFGALKRAECEAYAGTVTDWEWTQYAFHA